MLSGFWRRVTLGIMIASILAFPMPLLNHLQPVEAAFSSTINLSNNSGDSEHAQVALSGSNVYVVWEDDNGLSTFDIFFTRSTNNGATFGPAVDISNTPGSSTLPNMIASGSNVYVVWTENVNAPCCGPADEIYFTMSSDSGATFGSVMSLNGPHQLFDAVNPEVAVSSSISCSVACVYVVWQQARFFQSPDINFTRSLNNGATFSSPAGLTSDFGLATNANPKIAATGSNVYVAYDVGVPAPDVFFRASSDNGASFSAAINLSSNSGISTIAGEGAVSEGLQLPGAKHIAASGTNVYVVWQDNTGPPTGNDEIFFKRSTDNGATFGSTINLSNSPAGSFSEQMFVSGNNVYVIWVDQTGGEFILFRRSTNAGVSFGPTLHAGPGGGSQIEPRMAFSGSNIYAIWVDNFYGGNAEIFSSRSTDTGVSFGCFVDLSNTPFVSGGSSILPQVAASGSNAYSVWQDNGILGGSNFDIFFKRFANTTPSFCNLSTVFPNMVADVSNTQLAGPSRVAAVGINVYVAWEDHQGLPAPDIFFRSRTSATFLNGVFFNPTINLSNDAGTSTNPDVAASGKNVYVVWQDDTPGNNDVFFTRSLNNGATFSAPVNLSNNAGSSTNPRILALGTNVYLIWSDDTPGNLDVFFTRSTDGGATFGPVMNLSSDTGTSANPELAVSGSSVYVVWQDDTGLTPPNTDIFLARSTDNGATFGAAVNLSSNSGVSEVPQVASVSTNVYVIWRDDTPGNGETFYTKSTDGGATFSAAANLSNNAGNTVAPQIAAAGTKVYVTWQDDTPGNNEILFKRSTDSGATFIATVNLSNNAGSSEAPKIAASGSLVHVAWKDSTPGNAETFFRASGNGGGSFDPTVNLSSNAGSSVDQQVVASGFRVYVLWRDNTPGGFDVFIVVSY